MVQYPLCSSLCVNTVHWYTELSYATCSSVQRLLSALSCFVRLTQGFIKCRVGRHDAGGLWKRVLMRVCGGFTSLHVYFLAAHRAPVVRLGVPARMLVFAYDYMCALRL